MTTKYELNTNIVAIKLTVNDYNYWEMENYKILERIGEGTHGQVVQAVEQSGKIVAIKCVRSLDKASKNLLREIESLKTLDSNYVGYRRTASSCDENER